MKSPAVQSVLLATPTPVHTASHIPPTFLRFYILLVAWLSALGFKSNFSQRVPRQGLFKVFVYLRIAFSLGKGSGPGKYGALTWVFPLSLKSQDTALLFSGVQSCRYIFLIFVPFHVTCFLQGCCRTFSSLLNTLKIVF